MDNRLGESLPPADTGRTPLSATSHGCARQAAALGSSTYDWWMILQLHMARLCWWLPSIPSNLHIDIDLADLIS
jgi:hypothetical protein